MKNMTKNVIKKKLFCVEHCHLRVVVNLGDNFVSFINRP